MTKAGLVSRWALAVSAALLLASTSVRAQEAPPPATQALSQDQLDTLVAPIALYPDRLVSQVLVAATYPLEIVEAAQWLQRNPGLQGAQLVDGARQQSWDASIQALVAFPDVINRLNSDIRWTTDLGNAFLAQQADVMNAIQDMRGRARAAGRLNSGPQETVTDESQGDETAIDIEPTDPRVVYVPSYDPAYVWGPPAYGYYPPLYYSGVGFGFGPGIYVGAFFGGLGWGGWGWSPDWFGRGVFENGFFFHRFGFRGFHGDGRFEGRGLWAHNAEHRLGVPYPRGAVASRFSGAAGAWRGGSQGPSVSSFGRPHSGGSLENRGSGAAVRGFAQPSVGARPSQGTGQTTNHFGAAGTNSFGRGTLARPNPGFGSTFRSSPNGSGSRPNPSTYRATPHPGGGGFRPTPSYTRGNTGGSRSSSSSRGSAGGGGSRGGSSHKTGSSAPRGGGAGRHH